MYYYFPFKYQPLLVTEPSIKKVYTKVPVGTIAAIVSVLNYYVSPVAFIPDFIPGTGQFSDQS